jgi:plastocyanin
MSVRWFQKKMVLAGAALVLFLPVQPTAYAGALGGIVSDTKGRPVKDAVVFATALFELDEPEEEEPPTAVMDQVGSEYVPFVLPVRVGTGVTFPNSDEVHHHVYSFSPTKQFDIPLYKGGSANPVIFDSPGIVALGCNIHDWMLAYIYILETPYFARTDDKGRVLISYLQPGEYQVQVWHPNLKGRVDKVIRQVTVEQETEVQTEFTIKLRKSRKRRRSPTPGDWDY